MERSDISHMYEPAYRQAGLPPRLSCVARRGGILQQVNTNLAISSAAIGLPNL